MELRTDFRLKTGRYVRRKPRTRFTETQLSACYPTHDAMEQRHEWGTISLSLGADERLRPMQGVHGIGRQIDIECFLAHYQLHLLLCSLVGQHHHATSVRIAETCVR